MYAVTNRIKVKTGHGHEMEETFGKRGGVEKEPGVASSAASSPSSARCWSGVTWVFGCPGRWTPNTGTVRLSIAE